MTAPMPPPGWYADPEDGSRWRWWDGRQWTTHFAPAAGSVDDPGTPADPAPPGRPVETAAEGGADDHNQSVDVDGPSVAPVAASGRGSLTAGRLGLAGLVLVALAATGIAAGTLVGGASDSDLVAAPEPTAEVEPTTPVSDPEPEPEPEPVELRSLDWVEQLWTTDCTADRGVETHQLEHGEDHEGRPALRVVDHEHQVVYEILIEEGVFGDITGDGQEEAIFEGACHHGNHFAQAVEVWTVSDDEPVQLDPVLWYTRDDGLFEYAEFVDGRLRIHTSEPAPWDDAPHLNGYPVEVVTDWSYEGKWVASEVSRSEAPGPIELRGDGLGSVRFGDDHEEAIARLTELLGAPDEDPGWEDPWGRFGACPGESLRGYRWGTLWVAFVIGAEAIPDGFFYYSYVEEDWEGNRDRHALQSAEGVGLGATVEELVAAHADSVSVGEGLPGETGWNVDTDHGPMGGAIEDGRVTSFWAGGGCGE